MMKKQVRNVGLCYILLTIILTSCAWLLLDVYLIYMAGFQRSLTDSGPKLPLDERGVEHRKNKEETPWKQFEKQDMKMPTDRFQAAIEKMRQMQQKERVVRHFTGQFNVRAANDAAAKRRQVDDSNKLRFNEQVQQENRVDKPMNPVPLEIRPLANRKAINDTQLKGPGVDPRLQGSLLNRHGRRDSRQEPLIKGLMDDTMGHDQLFWEKIRDTDVTSLPRDPNGPGEGGKAVVQLPEEKAEVQREWSKAEFNLYLNSKMSLERSLTDVRMPSCRGLKYPYNALPKTSVIICFTDEAWPTLLRSVHSVLNRSPPELLEEVILVDDFSQAAHLQGPLEDYISKYPKVKLIRLPTRQGLIRARLAGVKVAKGPVLTFLDSHIEATVGWLEPLLERIRHNSTNVVCPVIDSIDARNMRYSAASNTLRGGFTWVALQFRWRGAPNYVLENRKSDTEPVPSPTMAGGLFSIDKEFFLKLGSYDPGLEIWGAENLELSFKSWMCGGRLEIVPCSHVGHIFRSKQPYKFPSGDNVKTFLRNTLRVVNVWLDDYKKVFYAVNPDLLQTDFGDVSDRLQLKKDLQCKNFEWYVRNVYPTLEIPPWDVVASGDLVNAKWKLCLDKNGRRQGAAVFPCHGLGGNQAFRLTRDGVLAMSDFCFGATRAAVGNPLAEVGCDSSNVIHWNHSKGGIMQNSVTGLCLGVATDKKLVMMPCFNPGPHLQWTFKNYFL